VVSSYGGNDEVDVGRGADRLADAATTPSSAASVTKASSTSASPTPSSVARPRLPRRPVHVRREGPGEDRIVAHDLGTPATIDRDVID